MRSAVLLLALAVALILSALNAAAVFDGLTAIYANEPARKVIAGIWLIVGLALGAMALALLSRRAYRQVEQDFPEHGIGAADVEPAKRERI
jgi:uncharacterized BrkB/YihY/UPF0761 family membrane protein